MSATDLTLAEIQALPVGSEIEDKDGELFERTEPQGGNPSYTWTAVDGWYWTASQILDYGPVKIVSTP